MKKKKKQALWIIVVALVLVLGLGYYAFTKGWILQSVVAATEEPAEETINTAVVRRGDLLITASGSGQVIAAQEYDLGFSSSSSKVAELYVNVGDIVSTGDILAEADNLTELEATVKAAEIDLMLAEEELQNLYDNSEIAIAEAQAALANAKIEQEDAWVEDYYTNNTAVRCDDITIELYEIYYDDAVESRMDAEDDNDGSTRALEKLLSAQESEQSALANLNYCKGMTDENDAVIASTDLTIADITVQKAEAELEYLLENDGIDMEEKLQLELNVANAELALQTAQASLDNAQLTSPIDGVVTSVSAYVGQSVGSSSFITITDNTTTMVSVYVDETDMDNIGVGYEVEITFDAIEDRIFYGTITTVYPTLVQSGMTNAVYGEAVITDDAMGGTEYLLQGMNASVEVIGGRADDAVLVPVEALREVGDGQYSVFVMENDTPQLVFVEVGLMDYYYAEILSGLEEGAIVTTGIVEVE